jgi:hypothetical protein
MVYARVATPMATSHGKAPAIQTKAKPNAKVVTKAKMADAKTKANAKFQPFVSDLACPFRNLMKYRLGDGCKKANNNVEPFL